MSFARYTSDKLVSAEQQIKALQAQLVAKQANTVVVVSYAIYYLDQPGVAGPAQLLKAFVGAKAMERAKAFVAEQNDSDTCEYQISECEMESE